MPSTQPLVEDRKVKFAINKQIHDLAVFIGDLTNQKRELESKLRINNLDKHVCALQKQHRDLHLLIADLIYQKHELKKSLDTKTTTYADRTKFVRQCPANGCRGFLSTQWKCGICDHWACPECHEVKGLNRDCDHTCDPNSMASAQLLAKDSKPCPKCQSLIFKIEGCNQMWCTQCHTAFNWLTGKLETNIHNPHFFEWQRLNNRGVAPRNPLEIECGRELMGIVMNNLLFSAVRRHSKLRYFVYGSVDYNTDI